MVWYGDLMRDVIRSLLDDVINRLYEVDLSDSPLLVTALLPPYARAAAVAERVLTTVAGRYVKLFFRPYFSLVEDLSKPFDFTGVLRGERYWVKAVSSVKAFNSTTASRVVREAEERGYSNAVVLTLTGSRRNHHVIYLKDAVRWYDAPASWALVTGERGAYRRFKQLLFSEGRNYWGRINEALRNSVRR